MVGAPGGGSLNRVHPKVGLPVLSHFFHDKVPYHDCCQQSHNCDKYYEKRPSDDSSSYVPPQPGNQKLVLCWCRPIYILFERESHLAVSPKIRSVPKSSSHHFILHRIWGLITEHTEYQFPKEQTLKQNSWRDKNWRDRPRKSGYTIFPPKDRRKLPKEHDYRLFCLFRKNRYSVLLSGAELTEYYSVH